MNNDDKPDWVTREVDLSEFKMEVHPPVLLGVRHLVCGELVAPGFMLNNLPSIKALDFSIRAHRCQEAS